MSTKKPEQRITGHVDLVHPTKYVKAADLRGKDVTIIIDGIFWEDLVMAGGVRDRKPSIRMLNTNNKPLGKTWIVGKLVMREIASATGEKMVEKWIGKRVTMYPTTCKGKGGEVMECIRVRCRVNPKADEVPEDMAKAPEPTAEFADEAEGASGEAAT